MLSKKGFLLSAGFGTRFKPQSLYLPKPALPFLNLPQALFPASALKSAGVNDFFYNSHHLSNELNSALSPYFKRKSKFEKNILDSAGGIANSQTLLKDQEDFWVANGDSLVFLNDQDVLNEAFFFHKKNNALATLIGITKTNKDLNGLDLEQGGLFKGISKSPNSLHFVGFYIFNHEIFSYLKKEKSHIFYDILLKEAQKETFVFDAKKRISWYETGNENDFLEATKDRLLDLKQNKENSQTYKSLKLWNPNINATLNHFLEYKVWGSNFKTSNNIDDFICIGENSTGDFSKLNNSILGSNLNFKTTHTCKEKVLIHPSQWT